MAAVSLNPKKWQGSAACRGPHQAIFFPPAQLERRADKRAREARAREICGTCDVQGVCLEYAMTVGEQHGIWGGLNEHERRDLRSNN